MDDVMVFVVVMVAAVVATCLAVWVIVLYQDMSGYRSACHDLSAEADMWRGKYYAAASVPPVGQLADLMAGWVGSCRECGKDRPLGDATGLCYDCQESELEGLLDDMASLVAKVMPPDEVGGGHAAVVAALNGALCDLCGPVDDSDGVRLVQELGLVLCGRCASEWSVVFDGEVMYPVSLGAKEADPITGGVTFGAISIEFGECDLCGTKYVLGSDDHNGETGICNDCDARDAERDRDGGRPWVDYDATPPFGIVRFPLGEV